MAAVTICSDFGAQKDKVGHCFREMQIKATMRWFIRITITIGEGKQQPTPVFLPGKSHVQKNLGLLSLGSQELDTTEVT